MSWTVSFTDGAGMRRHFQARAGMAVTLRAKILGEDFTTARATITRNDPSFGIAGFMITYPGDARWIREDWLTELRAFEPDDSDQP